MAVKITVLGAGPGGYIAAIRAAQLEAEVTVIERERVGGVCLNWGCIPTKTIKATADVIDSIRTAREYGVDIDQDPTVDMKRVMDRKKEVVDTLIDSIRSLFTSYSIRFVEGEGSMVDPRTVRVNRRDGTSLDIRNDKLILATGSTPLDIPSLPMDGVHILSSNHALMLEKLPQSMLIVGGGVVGCEFAFIFRSLGCDVTVVEALERVLPLPSIDTESSKILEREMKKRKIRLMLKRSAVGSTSAPHGRVQVTLGPSPMVDPALLREKDRRETSIEVDSVLVCVGRKLSTSGNGFRSAGLELHDRGWVIANEKMETNLSGVYAVGDILGPERIMLAHAASAEALTAVENALGGNRRMDYDTIPSGIFTTPEVAGVGVTEQQAGERGLDVRTESFMMRGLGKAQADGRLAGHLKLVSEASTGRVRGIHIVGQHAAELINEASLAVRAGVTVEQLASTIHVHPTFSEAFMEAAHAALDAPLHAPRE